MDTKDIIDSKTLVPLGLVGSCVVILVGAILWLANVSSAATVNTSKLTTLEQRQEKYKDTLDRVDRRLSRIEGKLGIIIESKEDL